MFEHYSEVSRRVIFFARYEASQTGATEIECEHLLLGMLREDTPLRRVLDSDMRETLRKRILSLYTSKPRLVISADMPLSRDAKCALAYAAEESERLRATSIEPGHLFLGVLRAGGVAAELARECGVDLDNGRTLVGAIGEEQDEAEIPGPQEAELARPAGPLAPSLSQQVDRLNNLITRALTHLDRSDSAGEQ